MVLFTWEKHREHIEVLFKEIGVLGGSIPEWFEFQDEELELYSDIPIIEVDENLLHHIVSGYIPPEIAEITHRKAFNDDFDNYSSDFVMVCEDRAIVVFVAKDDPYDKLDGIVKKIGRVHPKLEEKMVRVIKADKDGEIFVADPEDCNVPEFSSNLFLDIGLTRREKEMKTMLHDTLEYMYDSPRSAVEYFFFYLFPNMCSTEVSPLTKKQLVDDMIDYLSEGWDEDHERFGDELLKYLDGHLEDWVKLRNINKDVVV